MKATETRQKVTGEKRLLNHLILLMTEVASHAEGGFEKNCTRFETFLKGGGENRYAVAVLV